MINLCKNCGNEFITKRHTKQHCSKECFQIYRKRPDILIETIRKRKESNLKKYGVDNPAKNLRIKEKAKKTCQLKYGTNSPSQNKLIKKKQEDTNLKKYGVTNAMQNRNIQENVKNTMLSRHGVKFALQNKTILTSLINTCIKKYGVDNPAKNINVKKKAKETCQLRYGTDSPSQNTTIKNKLRDSIFKHSYENLFNNEKFINIIPQFDFKNYIGNVSYRTLYKFKCKICNLDFEDTLISGNIPMCPICFPAKSFYMQSELVKYIKYIFGY